MRKLVFHLIVLDLAFALYGCSELSSPTSSSPTSTPVRSFPSGTTFTVISGETQQPVSGARLVVDLEIARGVCKCNNHLLLQIQCTKGATRTARTWAHCRASSLIKQRSRDVAPPNRSSNISPCGRIANALDVPAKGYESISGQRRWCFFLFPENVSKGRVYLLETHG